MADDDLQINIFNEEIPTKNMPRMNCTNDEQCKAEADDHLETCPVEQELRRTFGY